MIIFCNLNNLKSLFNVPDKPASTDFILTNCPSYFQHSTALETGLPGSHLFTKQNLKRVFKNESLKLSNTVITKTLTTISLDPKY